MREKNQDRLNEIRGVVFDFDGTLADSMNMWLEIDIEYMKRINRPLPDDLRQKIEGMSIGEVAVYFQKRFELDKTTEEIIGEWHEMAAEAYAGWIPLKPGVMELLIALKRRGIKCGIATSNSRELLFKSLERHKLTDFFDAVLTGDDVTEGKPSPEIYLKAAEKMDVEPENCLVFEDVPSGILAGKNAGMSVVAVYDDATADVWDEKVEMADYAVHSMDEAQGLFRAE